MQPGTASARPGDEDRGPARVGGRHAGHDAERHQQPVLEAQHQLAHARQPGDALGLAEGVLLDVPACLLAGRVKRGVVL